MLRAELFKARTVPVARGLILGGAATTALVTAGSLSLPAKALEQEVHSQQFYFVTSIVLAAFALVLGARSFTDEFRHGSVVPTFAVQPRRRRVLVAKMASSAILALVLAVVSEATMLGVAFGLASTKGAAPAFGNADAFGLVGMAISTAMWAAIGVGLGAAVRHQVAAIVGGILWVVVVENVASSLVGEGAKYLPGQAGHALAQATGAPHLLSQPAGGLVLLIYAVVVAVIAVALVRRDVEPAN